MDSECYINGLFLPTCPIGLTDFRHDLRLSFRHFCELPAYQTPEFEA